MYFTYSTKFIGMKKQDYYYIAKNMNVSYLQTLCYSFYKHTIHVWIVLSNEGERRQSSNTEVNICYVIWKLLLMRTIMKAKKEGVVDKGTKLCYILYTLR